MICVCSFSLGSAQTIGTQEVHDATIVDDQVTLTRAQLDSINLRKANLLALKKQDSLNGLQESNTAQKKKSSFTQKVAIARSKRVDSMEYIIDRTFTKEQLKALALKINKEHTAVLGYSDIKYDANDNIIQVNFNLIDSRLRQSTYKVVAGSLMNPLTIYEYPDGQSGFMPYNTVNADKDSSTDEVELEPIPQEILDRIAAQEKAAQERKALREKEKESINTARSSKTKPKIIVRSSTTVPKSALSKEQQELRKKKNISKGF